jgi:DNA-binding NtrC family response regulator
MVIRYVSLEFGENPHRLENLAGLVNPVRSPKLYIALSSPKELDLESTMATIEEGLIKLALQNNDGNFDDTMNELGISSRVLRYKINKYDIDAREYRPNVQD